MDCGSPPSGHYIRSERDPDGVGVGTRAGPRDRGSGRRSSAGCSASSRNCRLEASACSASLIRLRRRRPGPGPAAASASATCSRIWASSGLASGVVRRHAESIASRTLSSMARSRRSRPAAASRGTRPASCHWAWISRSLAWAPCGSASTSSASASASRACLRSRLPRCSASRAEKTSLRRAEERVLRGPEPFPELLLGLLGRARRGLPLGHQLLEPVGGRGPVGRVRAASRPRRPAPPCGLRLLALRVQGGEVGAAAAGEARPGRRRSASTARRRPSCRPPGWSSTRRGSPGAGPRRSSTRWTRRRASRPPRPARSCGPGPRRERRRGRRGPRRPSPRRASASLSSRAASAVDVADHVGLGERGADPPDRASASARRRPRPLASRASMRSTSVTRSAKRRAKCARPSSGRPACQDPTTRSPVGGLDVHRAVRVDPSEGSPVAHVPILVLPASRDRSRRRRHRRSQVAPALSQVRPGPRRAPIADRDHTVS